MARKKATKSDIDNEISMIRAEIDNPLNFKLNVKCKTKKQKEFLKSIFEKEITIVDSPAGVGKSFIGWFGALSLLKDPTNGYDQIVSIYPPELDKTEALGWTPGDINQKISVYTEADINTMEKIFSQSGKENGRELIEKLITTEKIVFRPSTYLRGFTFSHSIVIINEAQNFSKDSFLKILTRIGENSKYLILSDRYQVDANSIKTGKNSMGLLWAKEKLADLPEFGFIEFGLEDILRNDVIIKILKRWDPEVYGDLDEEKEFKKAREERLEE